MVNTIPFAIAATATMNAATNTPATAVAASSTVVTDVKAVMILVIMPGTMEVP